MVSKCANPGCPKVLMRLDGGRFYGFPTSPKHIEHFWLCTSCSREFTLTMKQGQVTLVERQRKNRLRA